CQYTSQRPGFIAHHMPRPGRPTASLQGQVDPLRKRDVPVRPRCLLALPYRCGRTDRNTLAAGAGDRPGPGNRMEDAGSRSTGDLNVTVRYLRAADHRPRLTQHLE